MRGKLSPEAWHRRRGLVFRALNNALDNGYDQSNTPAQEVADSLVNEDAELEDEHPDYLLTHILDWQRADVGGRDVSDCAICGGPTVTNDAHRHQGKWIGECCWDERLRSSE